MSTPLPEQRSVTGLLPCPFCHGVDLAILRFPATEQKTGFTMLQCNSCGCTGPVGETEEYVRLLWDIRGEAA